MPTVEGFPEGFEEKIDKIEKEETDYEGPDLSFLAEKPNPEKDQAEIHFNISEDKKPDDIAKSLEISKKTGLHPNVVRDDMKAAQLKAQKPEWDKLDDSVVKFFAAHADNAAISKDDHENLNFISKTWKTFNNFSEGAGEFIGNFPEYLVDLPRKISRTPGYLTKLGKDVKTSFDTGSANTQLSYLYLQKYIFDNDSYDAQIAELETHIKEVHRNDIFGNILTSAAEQVPNLINLTGSGAEEGMKYAMAFGLGALALGQAGPQALAPEEALTVPIASGTGFKIGFSLGFGKEAFILETGHAAKEFSEFKDEEGNHLDPSLVKVSAATVGLINAGLEFVGGKKVLKTLPGGEKLLSKMSTSAIKKALRNKSVRAALLGVTKRYGGAITVEMLTEMAQEAVNIFAGEIAKDVSGQEFENIKTDEAFSRILEAGKKAMFATIGIGAPGSVITAVKGVKDANNAKAFFENQAALNDAINESKTQKRSPDKMKEFLQHAGVDQEVYADPNAVRELFQEDLSLLKKLGVTKKDFNKAKSLGHDIKLNIADIHTQLEAEQAKQLLEIVKAAPGGMSVKNVNDVDIQEEISDLAAAYDEATKNEKDFKTELKRVRDEIIAVGNNEEYAKQVMKVLEAFSRRMALEGQELNQTLKKIKIQRGNKPVEGELNQDILRDSVMKDPIKQDELIGDITRGELAARLVSGDMSALEDIKKGIKQHGVMQVQDAVRNDILKTMAYVSKEERQAIKENLKTINPELAVIFGETTEKKKTLHQDNIRAESNTFKEWFGDSKIVNENGEPLVVYHGTTKDFTAFNPDKSELGVHFAKHPDVANARVEGDTVGGESVIPAYIRMENPIDLVSDLGDWSDVDTLMSYLSPDIFNEQEAKELIRLDDDKEVRRALQKKGYDGIIYENTFEADEDIFEMDQATSYIVFDPTQIKSVNNRGTFDSGDPRALYQDKRASVIIGDQEYIYRMFENADISSIIHETGHVFLAEFKSIVESGNTSKQLINDWGTIQQWLGVNLHEGITDEQHEKFAKGFEQYLMEGEAPSVVLEKPFERFKKWLIEIYKDIAENYFNEVNLNDEVRGVFDRLLATDAQIDQFSAQNDIQITEVEMDAMNLSDEDKIKLRNVMRGAKEKSKKALQKRITKDRNKKLAVWRKEAELEIEADPVYVLRDELVKNGGLDSKYILDNYGEKVSVQLRAKNFRFVKLDGYLPFIMAETHGFESEEAMIQALIDSTNKRERKKQIVDMKEREHYSSFNAEDAMINWDDGMADYLETVGVYIAKTAGTEEKLTRAAVKRFAEKQYAETMLKDALRIDRYLAAMNKAVKEEKKAIKAGDFDAALKFNRQARLNYEFARRVKKLQEKAKSLPRRVKRALKSKGKIEPDYLKNLAALAERYKFIEKSKIDHTDKKTLSSILTNVDDPLVDVSAQFGEWIIEEKDERTYKELSVEEFEELEILVKHLEGRGRDIIKDEIAFAEMKRDDLVQKCIEPTHKLKRKKPISETAFAKDNRIFIRNYFAEMKMPLFNFRAMDAYSKIAKDEVGPNEELLYYALADAHADFLKIKKDIHKGIQDNMKVFTKRVGNLGKPRKINIDVPIPDNMEQAGYDEWTFERVLSIALNMGTEYNKDAVQNAYGFTDTELWKILSVLSDEDWVAIQNILDIVGGMYDKINEVHRRINHVDMPKVKGDPFHTPTGRLLNGGYYPLRWDSIVDIKEQEDGKGAGNSQKMQEQEELEWFRDVHAAAFPPRAASHFSMKRVGTGRRPVKLKLSVLAEHIEYITKYTAFAETVRDIDRVISHKDYRKAAIKVLGREGYSGNGGFRKVLKDTVRPDRESMSAFDKKLNKHRRLATSYILGANVSVALKQPFSLPGFWSDEGAKTWVQGIQHVMKNPLKAFNDMRELSPTMEDRYTSFDKDIAAANKGVVGAVNFILIHTMDSLTVFPSWWGAYIKADNMGLSKQKAVRFADEAIASSQPSSRPFDQSYIQRSPKGVHRLFTMFSTFTMKFGNRMLHRIEAIKQGQISKGEVLRQLVLDHLVPPIMMHVMFTSLWGTWGEWELEDLGWDVLLYQLIGFPFIREASMAVAQRIRGERARSVVDSPAFTIMNITKNAAGGLFELIKDFDDDKNQEKAAWALFDLLSYSAGIPVSKVVKKTKEGLEQFEDDEGTIFNILVPNPDKYRR